MPAEVLDIEVATAFLKKKYDENSQLLNDEVKAAMFNKKKRSFRNKKLLDIFTISRKHELLNPIIDAEKELDSLKKGMEDMERNKKEIDEHNRALLGSKKALEHEKENLRKLKTSDEWDRFNRLI
jgi:hypothetical protein